MSKRILAVILAALMGLMLLAGCGGDKDPDPDTSAAPSAEPPDGGEAGTPAPDASSPEAILATYPKQDLGGYEFVFRGFGTQFTPTEISSPIDEAKDTRNRMIEEYFNCKFTHILVSPEAAFTEGQPAILGGDKWADIMTETMWATSAFVTGNLLLDLNTVSTLNLKAPYWDQQVIKATTMNGKTYEIAGDIDPNLGWAVAFNKRIVEELKLESPYDLINKNEWTFAKYRELSRLATKDNGDGVMTNADDQWGHCGPVNDYQNAFIAATTLPIIGMNDQNQMGLRLDDPRWPGYLKQLTDLFVNDGTFMDKEPGTGWDSIIPVWQEGRVLFFGYMANGLMGHCRDMEDDWGIVPIPKAEASQENYGAWIDHNTPMLVMTVTNPEPEKTGMLIDAMCNLSTGMIVPVFLETNAGLYLRDDESVAMLDLIRRSAYYDAVFFLRHGIGELGSAIALPVDVSLGKKEFASGYEEIAPMVQDALDQFFEQGIYAP